jgi:hypothetical protein
VPVAAVAIITLAQAKEVLNITATTYDAELNTFIASASQMIVNRIGFVAGSLAISEWYDGGATVIMLRSNGPIQSVTAVTESYGSITYTLTQVAVDTGSNSTAYGYSVDLDRGLLVRRASGVPICFGGGKQSIHVTYVGGYTTTPADIIQACQLLVRHMWETQRGPSRRPGSEAEVPNPNRQAAMPPRVEEILTSYMVPGIG